MPQPPAHLWEVFFGAGQPAGLVLVGAQAHTSSSFLCSGLLSFPFNFTEAFFACFSVKALEEMILSGTKDSLPGGGRRRGSDPAEHPHPAPLPTR